MSDVAEPMEIDLKLVLPGPEAEPAVVAQLRGHGDQVGELDPVRNVDIYLDTFDWPLMKNKLSLRYRGSNGEAMYTLKSLGEIEEGIAARMETEVLVDGPIDIPEGIPVKQTRKPVGSIIFLRKLLKHLQVCTDRRRYRP